MALTEQELTILAQIQELQQQVIAAAKAEAVFEERRLRLDRELADLFDALRGEAP